MLLSAGLGASLLPTILLSDQRPKVSLEQLVPRQFGTWNVLQQSTGQIINPQQAEVLTRIYTQTLSRSYVNAEGNVVMLSIAYGANQSDNTSLHYPEVCYPAQGFQVLRQERSVLATVYGDIPVARLLTKLGNRSEPVTYWSTVGDQVVPRGLRTKLTQLTFGFRGQIPDGLIFRVSSITNDASEGHELQAKFVRDLIDELPPSARLRLTGLAN